MTYICNGCTEPCTLSATDEEYLPSQCPWKCGSVVEWKEHDDLVQWTKEREDSIRADERRTIAEEQAATEDDRVKAEARELWREEVINTASYAIADEAVDEYKSRIKDGRL